MYIYGHFNEDELEQETSRDDLIKKIEEERQMFSKSKEKEIYKMDEQIRLKIAKKEGKMKGEKEKSIKIAINLMKKGLNLNLVSEVTKLPISKLQNLNNKT
jgi:DNA-directed RNA polymerase subunit E'/Rpb7